MFRELHQQTAQLGPQGLSFSDVASQLLLDWERAQFREEKRVKLWLE